MNIFRIHNLFNKISEIVYSALRMGMSKVKLELYNNENGLFVVLCDYVMIAVSLYLPDSKQKLTCQLTSPCTNSQLVFANLGKILKYGF